MGSSAGGHLAAMVSTYTMPLEFENTDVIDIENFLPNAQILCYPVICAPDSGVAHKGSYYNLIGERNRTLENALDPVQNVTIATPPAFIWHTADDNCVNVINSYRYASALRQAGVSTELHVFPHGCHGLGLASGLPHVAQWSNLLLKWLEYCGWYINK